MLSTFNNSYIGNVEASNINKAQEDLSPLITYATEQIGDREKMIVTVSVEDRSGTGIKEFRDYNNNLINGDSYTFEINRRGNYTFSAIDNNDKTANLKIEDSWVNPYLKGNTGRPLHGSAYWTTSNLREWLNSDKENVLYTSNVPDYENEPGFLTNFTEEEKNAILATQRKNLLSSTDSYIKESGNRTMPHANNFSPKAFISTSLYTLVSNYEYIDSTKVNDKVFLLTPAEIYHYIEKRGNTLIKRITPEAKTKNKITSNTYDWYIQGYTLRSESDGIYYACDNREYFDDSAWKISSKTGIVPAINIDKNYVFEDGTRALDLEIGQTVVFGRYLDAPIEWEVINISSDDIPLLLSKNIIDLKMFDNIGDQSRMYSDYISFTDFDVDMFDNIDYKPKNNNNDSNVPRVNIINKEDSVIRQNTSYVLHFEAFDEESGLDYIITPDGNKITSNNFSYLVDKNGPIIIKVFDKAGNCNNYLIYINNINAEPELSISISEEGWTKNDILVDIDSNNNVKFIKDSINVSNLKAFSASAFPNYVNYSGKEFNISGTVNLISYEEDLLMDNSALGLRFSYKFKNDSIFGHTLSGDWVVADRVYVKDLINSNNTLDFNFNYTIPDNYAFELTPYIECIHFVNNKGLIAEFEVKNVKYEITDKSDFDIESITLPNGDIINETSYIDRISTEGINTLTYKVLDSRGKETVKTITTKIDKTAPTLNLDYDKSTEITTQNIVVNINASDSLSGFKRIKLPDGNYITNSNSTYTISSDGSYTFECEDVAGNITTKTITINNIDKEKPNVSIDKNNNWTNKPIQININTRD